MPCEEHDRLERDFQTKARAEVSAHDGYKQRSIKKSLEDRQRTISERVVAETRFVNHIKDCAVCQAEERKGWEVNPHRLID